MRLVRSCRTKAAFAMVSCLHSGSWSPAQPATFAAGSCRRMGWVTLMYFPASHTESGRANLRSELLIPPRVLGPSQVRTFTRIQGVEVTERPPVSTHVCIGATRDIGANPIRALLHVRFTGGSSPCDVAVEGYRRRALPGYRHLRPRHPTSSCVCFVVFDPALDRSRLLLTQEPGKPCTDRFQMSQRTKRGPQVPKTSCHILHDHPQTSPPQAL